MPDARVRSVFRDALSGGTGLKGNQAEQRAQILRVLSSTREIKTMVDASELQSVRKARELDVSWTEIATALGVSRQAAWERFHELDVSPS